MIVETSEYGGFITFRSGTMSFLLQTLKDVLGQAQRYGNRDWEPRGLGFSYHTFAM